MAESIPRSSTSTDDSIVVLGGGPAGASAAISALAHGRATIIIDRSRFPRHKVCGEFLSPDVTRLLATLGIDSKLHALRPARVERMRVHIAQRDKIARLPEAALGLSRYALDQLLIETALARGASVVAGHTRQPDVIATGRKAAAPRGDRLFGFKAHFSGPADDAVELFFFDGCYVGINSIEGGLTNVCGLAPESLLSSSEFDVDTILRCSPALRERLAPLSRSMGWMFTGPLLFGRQHPSEGVGYLAGDALSFVDPFTGSGILSAIATGILAGKHAAGTVPLSEHLAACHRTIGRPFWVSSVLRKLASSAAAGPLLDVVPGSLLFWATRPRTSAVLTPSG